MRHWFKIFLLLFMFGLLVYSNCLNHKFQIDDYILLNNPESSSMKFIFSQWNPYHEQALGALRQQGIYSYYRPLAYTLFDLYYPAFKNNFWQYYLLNLSLFVFAASLIVVLIGRISGNYNLAFLAGLFFLIHPINGIVVNCISANIFAFQVIFILGTILWLWESLERKNDRVLYALSLLFSFLSLFWHESGIMIPFYVSAVILLFRKDPLKEKALYLFPYFLIVFFYILFRFFFVNIHGSILKQLTFFYMTGWGYGATLFRVFGWYIAQLFYPRGIVEEWATPVLYQNIFWDSLGALSLLLLFFLLFVRFAKIKICQLALAWFLIGFAPLCLGAFIVSRPNPIAIIEPHWLVFSSIGFFILIAYFFVFILDRFKKVGLVLLFVVIFAWGAASHAYNRIWADEKTYARFWSQQAPNLKLSYFYLAKAYQDEGAFNEARKYYRLALNGYSSDVYVYINVGAMDEQEGHWKEAELDYKRALKVDPFSGTVYNNLGALYSDQNKPVKAKEYFLQAVAYNPLLLEPRLSLAKVFLKDSQYKQAIDLCLKNLDIVSDDPDTLSLLIDIYNQKKDIVNLKKYAYRVIHHEADPEILTKLGVIMGQNGILDTALDCFIKAMRVAPDYKDAYLNAGTLLGNMGQYDKAIHIWELGSKIDPSDKRFKNDIAKAITLNLK